MQTLTKRQFDALTVYQTGGKIDKGMIVALTKKGYIQDDIVGVVGELKKPAFEKAESKAAPQDGLPDYSKRTWNSLSDLVERIERDGVEEVEMFNGFQVVTDKRTYSLAFGELTITEVEDA